MEIELCVEHRPLGGDERGILTFWRLSELGLGHRFLHDLRN